MTLQLSRHQKHTVISFGLAATSYVSVAHPEWGVHTAMANLLVNLFWVWE